MKIALAQLNYIIGNFEHNFQKIIGAIETAREQDAELVVFGELSICGYPPRDFLEFQDFIDQCWRVIEKLKPHTNGIGIIVGIPIKNPVIEGKDLYNTALLMEDGEVKHIARKTLLPTYDIFDEFRYFEPNREFQTVEFRGRKLALTVCEDIWNINDNPLYTIGPMDELIKQEPEAIINISASPFSYKHARNRVDICKANVNKYKIPMFYVNHAGAQTEIIFDGGSVVVNQAGQVYDELPYFQEEVRTYDLDRVLASAGLLDPEAEQPKPVIKLIHDALVLGIKDYFGKLGFKRAILGLSGGIDSAVTMALAAEALGNKNVMGLLMPSQFSSDHSVADALEMAEGMGSPHHIFPIKDLYEQFMHSLAKPFAGRPFDVTEENIQARSRAVLLMAMANKFNHILLNTSNKSEMAVGYGTLYGDMCGGLSVLGDVYKTQVFELAKYINRYERIIPQNIITKPPSAELKPDQFDTDSLPEYEILDKILYEYIEQRQGPKEIKAMGFDGKLVDRVLRLVNMNEWKRYQTAPVLRVSSKAFGMGRRVPIVAKYLG